MTRYNFMKSIEMVIPYFFPEIKNKGTIESNAFITFPQSQDNYLVLSITFNMNLFDCSKFGFNLQKLNCFFKFDGICSLEGLIPCEIDEINNTRTYLYKVPLSIAQEFKD